MAMRSFVSARASAAGKQPEGPGAQADPSRLSDLEVSDGADQGAPADPIDSADKVQEWYRDILGNPNE